MSSPDRGKHLAQEFILGARAFFFRQLRLALGLGLLTVLIINYGVRWTGGSVHPLSLSRIGDRADALKHYALHRVLCRCEDDVRPALQAAALRHGVPYKLVLSVARTESSLVHMRVSGTGAMGLMQLMPETARGLGVKDPFSVEENADGGARYLKQLLTSYRGNVRRALAAYNAGPGRIARRGALTMPAETRAYVGRVLSQ